MLFTLMCHVLFTIGAIDNIDVNPSSSTAMSSFHGTAASLHQNVTNANHGEMEKLTLSTDKFLKQLPDEYTELAPLYVSSSTPSPDFPENPAQEIKSDIFQKESDWMEIVRESSNDSESALKHPDISALLPMWRESSKSPAIIKHAISVITRAVEHLNPFQTCNSIRPTPLCYWQIDSMVFSRQIWCRQVDTNDGSTSYGNLSVLGDWLENSGWTTPVLASHSRYCQGTMLSELSITIK